MKKVKIHFYSHSPRIEVYLIWSSNLIPNKGDEITIDGEFISLWDKNYFKYKYKEEFTFSVKKITWNIIGEKQKRIYPWKNYDAELSLDWTKEEKKEVEQYLRNKAKEKTIKRANQKKSNA